MIDNDLILEIDGLIARLTINRPDTRNPLGHPGDGERFRAAATEKFIRYCERINESGTHRLNIKRRCTVIT